MKKTMMIMLAVLASNAVYAEPVQCPTVAQLKSEWSISELRNVEQSGAEVSIFQKGHRYGTDKRWYVYFTMRANSVDEAMKKAPRIIQEAKFVSGGISPFGYYSCGYSSIDRVTIYALANKNDADDDEDLR